MKKILFKSLAALLALLFVFSPLAGVPFELPVFAQESPSICLNHSYDSDQDDTCNLCGYNRSESGVAPDVTSGTTGDCTWTLENGHLTISGNGATADYCFPEDKAPWGTKITSLTIEEGVTSIGSDAFYDCTSLTSVALPNGLTSIGSNAFDGCEALSTIVIPGSVNTIINSFNYCSGLTSVIIEEGVETIGEDAFRYCAKLASVTIPNSVSTISRGAFSYCDALSDVYYNGSESDFENITISKEPPWGWTGTRPDNANASLLNATWHYAPVVQSGIWGDCTWTLVGTELTISGTGTAGYLGGGGISPWGTEITKVVVEEGITAIGEFAFSGCEALTEVSLPNSLQQIGSAAFQNCTSLESITIPENVANIGEAVFRGCSSLKSIIIPDGLKWIGPATFSGCSALRTAVLANVTYISHDIFFGCTSLTDVYSYQLEDTFTPGSGKDEYSSATWHYGVCPENTSLGGHSFRGYRCDYCSKKEFLIDRIEFEESEVFIIENTNGYFNETSGNFVYYSPSFPDFYVILKDGSRISESSQNSVTINGDTFTLYNGPDNQHDEPWKVGNTYEVPTWFEYRGSREEYVPFSVTCPKLRVTIEENPIASIEVSDISIQECTGGYYSEGQYYYSVSAPATVTLKNGETKQVMYYYQYNGKNYSVENNAWSLQRETPWTVGNTYEVTASLLGVSTTFNVTIKGSPIKSVEIDDVTMMEGSSGYENGVPYYHVISSFTVTLQDGTTKRTYSSIDIDGTHYSLGTNASELQSATPWTVGTYEVTGIIGGVSDTFTVTITESPVKSVAAEDVVVYKGIDSYQNGSYEFYSLPPVLSEVVLKDGTKAEIFGDAIIYNAEYYNLSRNSSELQSAEPWTPGNTYQVTGYLLGVSTTFNVTVKENPVDFLQLVKMPEKTEYRQGEDFNLKGAVIRIHYKDGSYEDVSFDKDTLNSAYRGTIYSEKIDRYDGILIGGIGGPDEIGQTSRVLHLFGKSCEIPIVVKKNQIKSLTLKENADKTVTITVKNTDNKTYDMTLLDIGYYWYYDENSYLAGILTDQGLFAYVIYQDGNSFSVGRTDPETGEEIRSNTLSSCDWLKVILRSYDYSWRLTVNNDMGCFDYATFDGKITAENIDDIASFAASMITYADYWYEGDWCVYKGNDVRKAVKEIFGIENIDLILSQNYDSKEDIYRTLKYPRGGGEGTKFAPSKISYTNGIWTIISYHDFLISENDLALYPIYLKLNNDLQILSFGIGQEPAPKFPAGYNGWYLSEGTWYYLQNGTPLKNQWMADSKGWCYLGSDGAMLTNEWVDDSVGTCYVDESGYLVYDRWIYDGIQWRYVDKNGYVLKNAWQLDSKGWCYVGADGYMYADKWHFDSEGLCYIGSEGYCEVNTWKKHENGWLYLNANGSQAKNGWFMKGTDWLYLGSDGFPLKSQWRQDSQGWCYLDEEGIMVTNNWVPDSVGLVFVGPSGYMVVNAWVMRGSDWLFVGRDGYCIKNQWMNDSQGWCYLGEDGIMLTNAWVKDSVGWCYLDGSGYWDYQYHTEPA